MREIQSNYKKVRCSLYDGKLEKKFWAEAFHTPVYLKNRTLASGLNQMMTLMTHVPKEKCLKWDKKAKKHYLVGYADNVKGYRLYNSETNKMITSRDVTIMEPFGDTEMTQVVISEDQETLSGHIEEHDDSEGEGQETPLGDIKRRL